jgi:hypothetical protein
MRAVGAVGRGTVARVDGRGVVHCGGIELAWWVGAPDRWLVPGTGVPARQRRLGAAPAYETSVRVTGGEVVHRVWAVGGDPAVVVEVENASPAPCAVAFVARVPRGAVTLAGACLSVDGTPAISLSHVPRVWIAGESTRDAVVSGRAGRDGPRAWRAPVEVAMLAPAAHRTALRASFGAAPTGPGALPGVDAVGRGWERHLARGMRTDLPEPWQARVDAARADLLIAPPGPAVAAALEDWGFDDEFARMWAGLGFRDRRTARRRRDVADAWARARAAADPVALLGAMRAVLVAETRGGVDVAPGLPGEWVGAAIAVHDAPVRAGRLSYAVRWHGERPALLWDAPAVRLRAPALAPGWSAPGGRGEALLAPAAGSMTA